MLHRFLLQGALWFLVGATPAAAANAVDLYETMRNVKTEQTANGMLIIQTPAELLGWKKQAGERGLNCPIPDGLYKEPESAVGITWRLECLSPDRSSQWKIRIVLRPNRPVMMQPW